MAYEQSGHGVWYVLLDPSAFPPSGLGWAAALWTSMPLQLTESFIRSIGLLSPRLPHRSGHGIVLAS
jgi:hypothetical protein